MLESKYFTQERIPDVCDNDKKYNRGKRGDYSFQKSYNSVVWGEGVMIIIESVDLGENTFKIGNGG